MTEKERYIQEYLNNKSATLSFYIPKILSSKDTSDYNWTNDVLKLIEDIKVVIEKTEIDSMPVNSFFNELFLLRNSNIKEVNDLLRRYNYAQILKKSYKGIQTAIASDRQLNDTEKLCLDFFANNQMLTDLNIIEYFLKKALLRDNSISFETFCNLFKVYARFLMKQYVPNPHFEFLSENQMAGKKGYSSENKVYLSRENIQNFYYMGIYTVLKDLFHELCHVKQYRDIKLQRKSDEFTQMQIKEEVLSCYLEGYYEANFEKISYEVEAELFAITELLKLFTKFGIHFEKNKNPYSAIVSRLVKLSQDGSRVSKGEMLSVDELFDSFIMYHPELLEIYPQLNLDYEVSFDDIVVRKDDFGRKD